MNTLILSDSVENLTHLRILMNEDKLPNQTKLTPLELEISGFCATCMVTKLPIHYVNSYLLFHKIKIGDHFKIIDLKKEEIDMRDSKGIIRYDPKIRTQIEKLKELYVDKLDNRRWLIASSQGKDSTLVTLLIWVMLEELEPHERFRPISIITSDTGIEPPDAKKYQKKAIDLINDKAREKGLPVEAYMVKPVIEDSFAVKVIGKGTKPSNSKGKTRGCTYWWKIRPVDLFIESLQEEVIIFLGVRNDESEKRKESIERYNRSFVFEKEDKEGNKTKGQYMCHPVHEVTKMELWDTLKQHEIFPWGIRLDELLEHYQDSAECPMQVGKQNQNSCGNSRNGCTICQMVNDDKMLQTFAETKSWAVSALKYRDLLRSIMYDQKMRKFPSYFRSHTDRFNPFVGVRQEIKKLKKKEKELLETTFWNHSVPLDGFSTPFYPDNEAGAFNLKARIMLLKAALFYQNQHEELEYVNEKELELIKVRWKEEYGWKENEEDLKPEEIIYENESLVLKADLSVNYGKGETTIENLVLPTEYNHKRKNSKIKAKQGDVRILNPHPNKPLRYLFYVHRDISGNEEMTYERIRKSEMITGEVIPYFFTNAWRFENGKRVFWNILSFVVCVKEVQTFEEACDYIEDFLFASEIKNEKPNWKLYIN